MAEDETESPSPSITSIYHKPRQPTHTGLMLNKLSIITGGRFHWCVKVKNVATAQIYRHDDPIRIIMHSARPTLSKIIKCLTGINAMTRTRTLILDNPPKYIWNFRNELLRTLTLVGPIPHTTKLLRVHHFNQKVIGAEHRPSFVTKKIAVLTPNSGFRE